MQKYFTIAQTTAKEYSAYRLSFVLWRVRMFISLLVTFFLWFSAFDRNTTFGTYNKTSMLSYILLANLIGNFVMGTRTIDVAGEINDGTIINYLLKPISFFKLYFSRDVADKVINLAFAFIETAIVIFTLKIQIVIPHNLVLGFLLLISGTLISFFLSLLLSFIGFWTTEVWAPRFLFLMIVFFLSGTYFPLDLLPKPVYTLLLLTPFPYLYYLPTKVFLGTIDSNIWTEITISFIWLFLIYKFALWAWKTGTKQFSFWGR